MEEMNYSEDRDNRVKDTGEVFTPDSRVQKMLEGLNFDWVNIDHDKTFLDPTCGSGNFLVALLKRGIQPENIYGVDLFQDNVNTTIKRLKEINPNYDYTTNIIQGDTLTCDFSFGRQSDTEALF
jgi:type I restriction-modification system DNA methylase subunit